MLYRGLGNNLCLHPQEVFVRHENNIRVTISQERINQHDHRISSRQELESYVGYRKVCFYKIHINLVKEIISLPTVWPIMSFNIDTEGVLLDLSMHRNLVGVELCFKNFKDFVFPPCMNELALGECKLSSKQEFKAALGLFKPNLEDVWIGGSITEGALNLTDEIFEFVMSRPLLEIFQFRFEGAQCVTFSELQRKELREQHLNLRHLCIQSLYFIGVEFTETKRRELNMAVVLSRIPGLLKEILRKFITDYFNSFL